MSEFRFPHPATAALRTDHRRGKINRREYLALLTSLGSTALVASPALFQRPPAAKAAGESATLRIQSSVGALGDPRSWARPEEANFARGWLEYLVEYRADGSFNGMLLEGWRTNEDATEYILAVRPGILWNNGDSFGAEDVALNFERWCDAGFAGNSMASRMSALSNTAGALRGDAVKILDEHTLRLRLSRPDITIIASMAEYPAAIVHPSFSGEDALRQPIGTGPYLPQSFEAGVKGVLVRNDKHLWWGEKIFGPPALDRIEFIDHGTDQTTWIAAAADGEVDLLSDLASDHVALMRGLEGWEQKEVLTAQTVVIRANQSAIVEGSAPYADRRVRKALALAVDNSVCRELGLGEQGVVAENHHICRIHPDYYDIGSPLFDPLHSRELLAQAGMLDFEHELISIEDDWRRKTADAAAAQLRAAGLRVRRTVIPEASFWNGWTKYPFSITNWGHRPLGIQIPKLAYYSGAAWNETGYANPQFDALVDRASSILDVELRREVMREIETTLIDDAVVIQPYWRKQYLFHRNTVVGAQAHPTGEIHLYKLAVR